MQPLSVLVIDDEPQVGAAIERLLRHLHRVQVVTSARQALLLCAGDSAFDVILCDLMMPGMTGPEFFREMVRTHPSLSRRIAFMTGGAFTPDGQQFLTEVTSPVLDKPFDRKAVLAVLERSVATREAQGSPLTEARRRSES